jgi:hypothetical protein
MEGDCQLFQNASGRKDQAKVIGCHGFSFEVASTLEHLQKLLFF